MATRSHSSGVAEMDLAQPVNSQHEVNVRGEYDGYL